MKHSLYTKGTRRESRSRSRERRDEKKESRSKKPSKVSEEKREPWLHPLLRVRCVDSSFKDGQFYKQKVL
jgi:hypothetical protein